MKLNKRIQFSGRQCNNTKKKPAVEAKLLVNHYNMSLSNHLIYFSFICMAMQG